MSEGLKISQRGNSFCIGVHLQPRARQTEIAGLSGEALRVRVMAPAIEDRANAELVRFLAHTLDLPARDVQILRGHKSRHKTVVINNIGEPELRRRLTQYLV